MRSVEPGTILAAKYRLEKLIGRGGMGAVWRAEHLAWKAPVAAKLLSVDFSTDGNGGPVPTSAQDALLQRFLGEARIAASIRSPHVVQILDHGVDSELAVPFIIMELLDGETLDQCIERQRHLPPAQAAHILTHVGRALTRMHEAGLVHRDLKPSNVFLVRNDDETVAKVLDFGIAKSNQVLDGSTPLTVTGQHVGTPFYMSPEQIRGQRDVDASVDLWAFGVLAFECLTGRRPFEGNTLGDLSLKICVEPLPLPSTFAAVPTGFDAWFLKAVQRDRAQRFASAKEAVDALRLALGAPSAVRPSPESIANVESQPDPPVARAALRRAETTDAVVSSAHPEPTGKPRRSAVWLWLASAVALATLLSVYGFGKSASEPVDTVASSEHDEAAIAVPASQPAVPKPVNTPSAHDSAEVPVSRAALAPSNEPAVSTEKNQDGRPPQVARKPSKPIARDSAPKSVTRGAPSSQADGPPSPPRAPKAPTDLIEDRL